jgi:isocitrate/isopropylmalate dehydrogenase
VAHRVGIIGGDGIGPEVIAVALDVVRAAGVALDTVDYDLGGRAIAPRVTCSRLRTPGTAGV